jgi:hypothetical protein
MVKENPDTKPKAMTAFQKFEQLAKKLIAVPKRQADRVQRRMQRVTKP